VGITAMSAQNLKSAITIAIRYSGFRKQFGVNSHYHYLFFLLKLNFSIENERGKKQTNKENK